jgi:ABC-2 type transport system ATP-binding protein
LSPFAPIECKDLTFAYKDGTRATGGVTLSLQRGELFCLLGPNGAGKTTLIKQILGDLKPTSGTVTIFGVDPFKSPVPAKRRIGVIPQNVSLFPALSVREHLTYFAALKGIPRGAIHSAVSQACEAYSLQEFLGKRAGALSGGQQRTVLFALAVLGDPEILILDEPTVGLDPIARAVIWDAIEAQRERGKAILLTTHYLEEAERLSTRIGFLNAGCLIREGELSTFELQSKRGIRLTDGSRNARAATTHFFETMEAAQIYARDMELRNYSVSQVSLQDVYFEIFGRPQQALDADP